MNTSSPAIVVPAFQRAHSLDRLLGRLEQLVPVDGVLPPVVVSLEGEATRDVVDVAQKYQSNTKLDLKVVQQPQRLGLKEHILRCGDLSDTYGSVIILEDDLVPDRLLYHFACKALSFYADDLSVAGVALYSPQHNEFAQATFRPIACQFDSFPMQVPCSWGQCWTREQWLGFRDWLRNHEDHQLAKSIDLPKRVLRWPSSSWKRLFAHYLVENNRYFIYPYETFTTNASSPGGFHAKRGTCLHQVDLAYQERQVPQFSFCKVGEHPICYDSFMEQCGKQFLASLGLDSESFEIDIYCTKSLSRLQQKNFAITARDIPATGPSYPLHYRPIEQNLGFPTTDVETLRTIEPRKLKRLPNIKPRMERYNYFANMNLQTPAAQLAFLKGFPYFVYRKILDHSKAILKNRA